MFSRQTGKTFTATLEIVLDCLKAESEGNRKRWVILSRGERQAKEAMDEGVKRHLRAFGAAFNSIGMDFNSRVRQLEVEMPGGSRITALPANPDTARGFSASVLLDEFAFHQDSREIWRSLFPVISAGHDLRVISTPNGIGNKFAEIMRGDDAAWSRHQCDIYQAVKEGLPRSIDDLRRALNDPDAWAQEFELEWLDEASSWLTYDLIDSCVSPGCDRLEYGGVGVFVGVDLAVKRDLWVAVVLEPVGDVLVTRCIHAEHRPTYERREEIIQSIFSDYRVARLCIDQTGLGEDVTQRYQSRYGKGLVEGIHFTSPNKLVLANGIRAAFEERRIRIPDSDELKNDLHKIKKTASNTGAARFDADSDSTGHADRFWAIALAIQAGENKSRSVIELKTASTSPIYYGRDGLTGFL
jgi:phage FluMu gp28-like protein